MKSLWKMASLKLWGNMKNLNEIQSAFMIMSEVEVAIVNAFGSDFYTNFKQTKEIILLQTNDFILTFSHKDLRYHLSFMLDSNCRVVAEVVLLITTLINPENLIILNDHFYDHAKGNFVYGAEAIKSKQNFLMERGGIAECIICNSFVAKEFIDSSGFCGDCAKNKSTISWN